MCRSNLVVLLAVLLACVCGGQAVLDSFSVQVAQIQTLTIFRFCNETNNRFVPGATLCRYDRNCFISQANVSTATYGPYLTVGQLNATRYSTFTISRTSGNPIPYFAGEVITDCCDDNCNCTPLTLANFPTCTCPPNLTPIGYYDDVGCVPGALSRAPAIAPLGSTTTTARTPTTGTGTGSVPTPGTVGASTGTVPTTSTVGTGTGTVPTTSTVGTGTGTVPTTGTVGAGTGTVPTTSTVGTGTGTVPTTSTVGTGTGTGTTTTGGVMGIGTPCISPELTAASQGLPYTCTATCRSFLAAQGFAVYSILTQSLPTTIINALYTNCGVPVPIR